MKTVSSTLTHCFLVLYDRASWLKNFALFISPSLLTILRLPAIFMARCWAVRRVEAPNSGSTSTFFGHQIVAHYKLQPATREKSHHNPVDGHDVPVPHFGVVLTQDVSGRRWQSA